MQSETLTLPSRTVDLALHARQAAGLENSPPSLQDDSVYVSASQSTANTFDVSVLANDSDPDGDELHLISAEIMSGDGEVFANDDGSLSVTYTGEVLWYDQSAEITISYSAGDGFLSANAVLTVTIEGTYFPHYPPHGTIKSETIKGTKKNDKLWGEGGNDRVIGLAGNDYLNGGTGKDEIYGDGGNDRIVGDKKDDVLTGGNGADRFFFVDADGRDTITDFKPGARDIIDLDFDSIANFRDLKKSHMSEHGDDVWITADGDDRIVVLNVSLENMQKSEFEF